MVGTSHSLLALAALSSVSASVLLARDIPLPTRYACTLFHDIFPDQTYTTDSAGYKSENELYWSSTEWLGPACVVAPKSVSEMSYIVKALTMLQAEFAVRGAGQMPIAGAANIGSEGVLVSTSLLTSLDLAEDKATLSVGAGNSWVDVQKHLAPEGLVAVGSDVGTVGVVGSLLGGGISLYGNQYGLGSSNVVTFECVLPGGDIIYASATQYADLFWSLKGGGNSFAIVTSVTLQVYESASVWVGKATYAGTDSEEWLDATVSFAHQTDSKAGAIPVINIVSGTDTAEYTVTRFYDDDSAAGATASVWKDLTMTPIADTYAKRSFATYLEEEVDAAVQSVQGSRQKFYATSSTATHDALTIVNKAVRSIVPQYWASIPGLAFNVAIHPITKHFIQQSGDIPQALNAKNGPYFWYKFSFSWSSVGSDEDVDELAIKLSTEINEALSKKHLLVDYLNMNDADASQAVFQGYSENNLKMLQAIRSKYDPERIFTDLMPGGWKVADV